MRQTRVAKRRPGPASWPLRLRPLAWGAAGALIVIRRFRWNPGPNSRCRPGAGSCRLRRTIRNPAPEVRNVLTPAPMPAG